MNSIQKHYVYFVDCTGFCKVGISGNLKLRMDSIKALNPFDVVLAKTIEMPNKEIALVVELMIHKTLIQYGLHRHLEWFSCDSADAIALTKEIIDVYSYDNCERISTLSNAIRTALIGVDDFKLRRRIIETDTIGALPVYERLRKYKIAIDVSHEIAEFLIASAQTHRESKK